MAATIIHAHIDIVGEREFFNVQVDRAIPARLGQPASAFLRVVLLASPSTTSTTLRRFGTLDIFSSSSKYGLVARPSDYKWWGPERIDATFSNCTCLTCISKAGAW